MTSADKEPDESTPVPAKGWQRLMPTWSPSIVALILAVFAVGILLLPKLQHSADQGPLTLKKAWPKATIGALPTAMPDGPLLDPVYLLGDGTIIGTAPTPDGTASRLVVHPPHGAPRTVKTVPLDVDPLYAGVTTSGDTMVWAETVSAAGATVSELWSANWRTDAAPHKITAGTGSLAFFNSQYDLVIADGVVHWVAVGSGAAPVTELRSVPLAGGPVRVQQQPGQWALSRWPWLVSTASQGSGSAKLLNLSDTTTTTVPISGAELASCAPSWCRVQVVGGTGGPTRLDLMRPDGADRRRVAGAGVSPAITDVALLDRFEVLTRSSQVNDLDNQQDLLLYDLKKRQTVEVAAGVGVVNSRDGRLWWSTGNAEQTRWHTLDLHTLS